MFFKVAGPFNLRFLHLNAFGKGCLKINLWWNRYGMYILLAKFHRFPQLGHSSHSPVVQIMFMIHKSWLVSRIIFFGAWVKNSISNGTWLTGIVVGFVMHSKLAIFPSSLRASASLKLKIILILYTTLYALSFWRICTEN